MKLNNSFIKNINILDGIIIYNDFSIFPNVPFIDQKYSFKEDILQIKFGERFILDVGWRAEFDENGNFIIQAIIDNDWINPLAKKECKSLDDLKKIIEEMALFISQEMKKNLPSRNIEFEKF